MKNIIIDCDPGIDDSLALIMALKSPEINVVGITIVSGNVHASKGAKNALKVLRLLDMLHIPVYVGEGNPLVRELITAEDTHGEDGLGETFIEEVSDIEIKTGAVEFILESAKKYDILTLVAIGPLTNLALALEKDKGSFNKLKEVILMGGAFKSHGNCSPVAEFNFWVDPHGADYVFKNIEVPVTMVGLDVTREVVLTPNYIELLNQIYLESGDKLAKFIIDITRFYVDFHWKQERTLGCVINDPLAIGYLLDNSLCSGEDYFVQVVKNGEAVGQSMVDVGGFYREKPNCNVLTKVDSKKFMMMFLNRLFPDYKEEIEIILNNNKYGV